MKIYLFSVELSEREEDRVAVKGKENSLISDKW